MDIKSSMQSNVSDTTAEEVVTIEPDVDDTFIGYTTSVVDFINNAPWENIVGVLGNEDVVIRIKAFKRGTPLKAECESKPEPTGEGVSDEVQEEQLPETQDTPSKSVHHIAIAEALKGCKFDIYEHAVAFYSTVKKALVQTGAPERAIVLTMSDAPDGYIVKLQPAAACSPDLQDVVRTMASLFSW